MTYENGGQLDRALKRAVRDRGGDPGDGCRRALRDRFLRRVFSNPDGRFILKGGSGLLARIPDGRVTRDIDFATASVFDSVQFTGWGCGGNPGPKRGLQDSPQPNRKSGLTKHRRSAARVLPEGPASLRSRTRRSSGCTMPSTAGPTSAWGSGRPTRSTTQGCCSCSENSSSKRRKQRYLDYALKRGVKSGIVDALRLQGIAASEVDAVSVVVDEHSTSIDGKYNLAESVDEELRCGMFNPTWQTSYPPVFSDWLPKIPVSYVDSSKVAMVRAADVTANWAFMAERDKETYPRAYEMLSKATVLGLL